MITAGNIKQFAIVFGAILLANWMDKRGFLP